MSESSLKQYRYFLKDSIRQTIDFLQTDQHRGIDPPPFEKPFDSTARRIDLVAPDRWQGIALIDLTAAIARRQSHRRFVDAPLSVDELSFLLWATQGIRCCRDASAMFRTVPSAGARHTFETYVCVMNVEGLEPAVYRYLPVEHQLLYEFTELDARTQLDRAALGQSFVGQGAITFVWTTIPYRMEWRYGLAAHKVIAVDAGHVCQNLYLACEAIGAGTCAVAAYDQEAMDRLLRVDGQDEFTIYLAPVGKIEK